MFEERGNLRPAHDFIEGEFLDRINKINEIRGTGRNQRKDEGAEVAAKSTECLPAFHQNPLSPNPVNFVNPV